MSTQKALLSIRNYTNMTQTDGKYVIDYTAVSLTNVSRSVFSVSCELCTSLTRLKELLFQIDLKKQHVEVGK